jgi:hypothetical protein
MPRSKQKQATSIFSKLGLMDIELTKITAEKLDVENDEKTIKSKRDVNYKIIKIDEKEVSIHLNVKIEFEPVSPFTVNSEFLLQYKIIEPVSEDEVIDNIEDLLYPCGNIVSLLVGLLSERMVGIPFVIPPVIEIKK